MIKDLISYSKPQDGTLYLNMSDEVFNAMTELRQFLYENVYRSPQVHNEFIKAKRILTDLYTFFLKNETLLQKELYGYGHVELQSQQPIQGKVRL